MARPGRDGQHQGAPEEQPQGQPRDLHPTSDIRFVMTEVATLTERISNLIDRVDGLKDDGKDAKTRLHEIEKSISFVKGAIWVFGALSGVALLILGVVLKKYLGA